MSKKATLDHKQLRAIGHKLKPVVTVAGNGLSDNVVQEIERALGDHELIKVKISVGDREARSALADELCHQTGATRIQSIGNVVLLLKRAKQPDPRLSNLIRVLA
ncbi:MAG TPA: ribosome assembly RNA-binding protein YhbY [Haliea salexigens]|uniref:Ribosome assembly RNA-binding protein YhbY n=1 Tax=Haliea salexigens TaxID=287487 RepID=A0A3C1KNE3_9GAMM|nr:ribosome assembly RNA-binding protein YhbY [Haliea sp.]HAN28232.1 ribosome assembly RNA-binding protein YhbY [Haliea salexigens]|tara:strand:+ start:2695 stop:3009 length:315 start_codon:yes stop_codon:yes gene_type:complete